VLRTAGGAALVATGWAVAGCDASPSSQPSPAPGSLRSSDPVTEAQRRAAIADENALIAAYQATETRHPTLHAILAIPLGHHAAHLKALNVPASASGSASPSSAVISPAIAPVPSDAGLALRSLAAQEQAVARRRRAACANASGTWAGLLGSLGACEAGHAALLGAT
jgi:hypothetical protein